MNRALPITLLLLITGAGCDGSILNPGPVGPLTMKAPDPKPGEAPTCGPGTGQSVGHYTLRRLTNAELTHTVQDLLYVTARPGDAQQTSPVGSSGYTNDSYALSVYSAFVGTQYNQAETIAHAVIASKGTAQGSYAKLVTCTPTASGCAQSTVSALARRALRRAVTADDLDATSGLMAVFNAGGSFNQGLNDVIISLLMHPEFMLIPVVDAQSMDPSATFALDDDEVASRLSYFLWQSMPDATLFAAADAHQLHDASVLRSQVARMLADPRAQNLKGMLRDEYAELSTLSIRDFTQVGQTNALRDALVGETDTFFDDLISNDRSALTILDSTTTFANKTLSDFYGLTRPSGSDPAAFVPLTSGRTGLGAQGAVLVNTAGGSPTFTNPVKRGHWLVNKMFCLAPPPPPANIPPLPAVSAENPTIRGRLEAHVANVACQACHTTMDNLGLGAENYDAFGKWRTTYADDGSMVDAHGVFPSGVTFADSKAMYEKMAADDQAKSCVAQQFFKISLSRTLSGDEQCAAQQVAQTTLTSGAHLSDLLGAIASSPQFLNQTGEAP